VDPERDDAETLAAYVGAFSDNLVGVRGAHEDLAGFAENLNVAFARVPLATADGSYDPNLYQVDHTANIVIVNPRGHYHGLIKYPHQAATIVATFQSLAANF
jgi:protein SCO1/2